MVVERAANRFKVEIYDGSSSSRKRYVGTFATRTEAEMAEAIAKGQARLIFPSWPEDWAHLPSAPWRPEMPPVTRLVLLAALEVREIHIARIAALCRISEVETESAILWLASEGHITVDAPLPGRRTVVPAKVREEVMQRDNATCQHCGTQDSLTLDHIKPVILGGSNDADNLRVLCQPCNSRKGTRPDGAWDGSLAVGEPWPQWPEMPGRRARGFER